MLKGFPGNISELMQAAQEMQQRMGVVQEELKQKEVEASVGGGMVTARVNGQGVVVKITVEPQLLSVEEKQMLEDLIKAAVNEAVRKSQAMMRDELSKLTGGLPIPGLFPGMGGGEL